MQNYIQKGEALDVVAPAGGVVSGQGLVVGKMFGVVAETVPAGVTFAFWRVGVYSLTKTLNQAWAQGDPLYWDAANSVVTNVNSGGLLPVGWAAAPAGNPSPSGSVLLGQAAS